VLLVKPFMSAVFIAAICASVSVAQNRAATASEFVIDANKAYVYLLFDHTGRGARFAEDEPATRIWFRLVNNCRVPILVRTFGVPDGSFKGEVGVMHDVVANTDTVRITSEDISVPLVNDVTPKTPSPTAEKERRVPFGYNFDVGSLAEILPGKSLLFSIPTTHLSEKWHIEIPYTFKVPRGKCCRPENIGGEPRMVLVYSDSYLPDPIRKQLGE